MDVNKLKTFYCVALEGSYQKASLYLGITPSYTSKQITSLEDSLKFKLFKRSHRSVVLTPKGEELFKVAQVIVNQLDKIKEISNEIYEEDNTIRIVTTSGVTNAWIINKLAGFIRSYPQFKIKIMASDDKVDISTHFADVAILPKIDDNPNIAQRKLFTFHTKLFASKDYLEKFGVPKNEQDLDHHRLVSYYHNEAGHRGNLDWHLRIGATQPRTPYLVINSAIGLYEALVLGLGIVVVTHEFPNMSMSSQLNIGIKSGLLVNILPHVGVDIPMYFSANREKMKLRKIMFLEKILRDKTIKSSSGVDNALDLA